MLHHKFQRAFKFHLHSASQLPHLWCCSPNLLISQKILNSSIQHNAIPGAMLWVFLRFNRQSRTRGSNLPEAVFFVVFFSTWLNDFGRRNNLKYHSETVLVAYSGDISNSFQKDWVAFFQLSAYLLFPRILSFLSVLFHRRNSPNLDITL